MRPVVPEFSPSPPRKLSSADPPAPSWSDAQAGSGVPTSFFLARETSDDMSSSKDSTFGVQSLEDIITPADIASSFKDDCCCRPDANNDSTAPTLKRRTTLKPSDLLHHIDRLDTPLSKVISRASPVPSRPLTPFNLNDDPSSMPSSPKSISSRSFKPLDDISITDEISSQAVVSSGEEDDTPEMSQHTHHGVSDSSSQLIMPSIRMPSRRPFTERGKKIGRFKILVAGTKGSGKSSLIKSIVQACDDIVHVDPVGNSSSFEYSRPHSRVNSKKPNATIISEIYASTKPYPPWWSDVEDSQILKRRKNSGEVVLERNLCFVDTSAPKNNKGQPDQNVDIIIQYMRQQLSRAIASVSHPNSDLRNMLAGTGGPQVDLILYLISEDTLSSDIECIRKLSDFSNVIPLISKADLLSTSQITSLKSSLHSQIAQDGAPLFSFEDRSFSEGHSQLPFAVSSMQSSDDDNMDASVLMNPDYTPPLVTSEISELIDKIFDSDNISWLRHTAAKKLTRSGVFTSFQRADTPVKRTRSRSPGQVIAAPKPISSNAMLTPFGSHGGASSYALARVNDYTQHEEKLAQVRLAKWAADLQQSLQNERERYAALARGERAAWLTERLGECVIDGTLVPIQQTPGFPAWDSGDADKKSGAIILQTSNGQTAKYRLTKLNPEDPLGLVRWNEDLRRRGWMMVQVVGSFGVVGGLALWLAKFWGISSQSLSEWHFHWIDPHD